MKTKTNPGFQRTLFVFAALGLAFALLAAPGAISPAQAQAAGPVKPPLFPGLTWNNLGATDQAIDVNGETVSIPGTLYQAKEKFDNLEKAPEAFFEYYASTALAQSGWTEIQTTISATGVSTTYFHDQGFIALVQFAQCDDSAQSPTCISVWESELTTLQPTPQLSPSVDQVTPATTFSKKTPSDSADNLGMPVTISWYAYTGSNLNRYRYCIDETDDDDCDTDIGWTNAWSDTTIDVSTLKTGKTYYWQIQAVLKDNTKVSANDGAYWGFSTVSFNKIEPASEARNQRLSVTLKWEANPYKDPETYKYCISKVGVTCTSWVSTTATSAQVKLNLNTSYQWQVKAFDADGLNLEADNGTWWNFSTLVNRPRFDFTGDLKEDIAFFRPSNGSWNIHGQTPMIFGKSGDIPVAEDYNGDGKTDLAVFRPSNGTWYIKSIATTVFGKSGDIPVVADYNGDGKADIAVFRPSNNTWFIKGIQTKVFGNTGDIPVVADYNGDGKADIAVFRPSEGKWYIYGQGAAITYGAAGDILVPADYNRDGKAEIAAFRPTEGKWYIRGQSAAILFGKNGDIPVPSDFNGDGKADIAIFRPSVGKWFIRNQTTVVYGTSGDVPIGAYYYSTP